MSGGQRLLPTVVTLMGAALVAWAAAPVVAQQRGHRRGAAAARLPSSSFPSSSSAARQWAIDPSAGPNGDLRWFQLGESQEAVAKRIGPPRLAAESGTRFISWQYQLSDADHHDQSHILLFDRQTRTLAAVTRIFEPEVQVDSLFPASSSSFHRAPGSDYVIRVREVSGSRVLLAPGCPRQGAPAGQVVLVRGGDLKALYPWLDERLALGSRP